MKNFDAAAAAIRSLPGAAETPMLRLRSDVQACIATSEPATRAFSIGHGDGPDAGVAVEMSAVRGDGRMIAWIVETWVYPAGPSDWSVNTEAEIDLDDRVGDNWCVLNEQEISVDVADVPDAITRAVARVTSFPLEDLLVDGWEPSDWDHDLNDD